MEETKKVISWVISNSEKNKIKAIEISEWWSGIASKITMMPIIYLIITILILIVMSTEIKKRSEKRIGEQRKIGNIIVNIVIYSMIITFYNSITLTKIVSNKITYNNNILAIIAITVFMVIYLQITKEYKKKEKNNIVYEFGIIIIITYIGMLLIVTSNDMIITVLGIEITSYGYYSMAGYKKKGKKTTVSGAVKYFIIGSIGSIIIILGTSIIYQKYSTTEITDIIGLYYYATKEKNTEIGITVILIGILTKLGIGPLHGWVTEVYYSSSTIATTLLIMVPKISLVKMLSRMTEITSTMGIYNSIYYISLIITVTIGTLGALSQTSIDKFIGMSSVANNGWIMLTVYTEGTTNIIMMYLIITNIIIIQIYLPVLFLRKTDNTRQIISIKDYMSIQKTNKTLGLMIVMSLMSWGGIPPLIGYYPKMIIMMLALDKGLMTLVIIVIILSIIVIYYILNLVKMMLVSEKRRYALNKPIKKNISLIYSILCTISILIIMYPELLIIIV